MTAEAVRPDTRTSIIEATERVLERVPLQDVTVAQVMHEAGVSRGTFYSYFASKFDPVVALLERVMEEMYDLLSPFIDRDPDRSAEDALREVLVTSTDLWRRHRPIFRATHDHWRSVPELRTQWLGFVERHTEAVAAELEREVAAGRAPKGIDSRQRAASVLWATEHLLYIAGTGADDNLPREERIQESLVAIWMGALFSPAGAADV